MNYLSEGLSSLPNLYFSVRARAVFLNPEDRKGLTMDFERLRHPLFGWVVRGFKFVLSNSHVIKKSTTVKINLT